MNYLSKIREKPVDRILVIAITALIIVGLVVVYSASITVSLENDHAANYYFMKQLKFVLMGLIALSVVSHIEYHLWTKVSTPIIVGTLLVMFLVHQRSDAAQGVTQWLKNGSYQPSELLKITSIIFLAHWAASRKDKIGDFKYSLVPFSIIMGVIAALVMIQGDEGTTILIGVTAVFLFFIAGARSTHIFLLTGVGASLAYIMASEGYRRMRIDNFLQYPFSPNAGGSTDVYQMQQMLIALGSGKLTGLGLGEMGHYVTVPLKHTDAIFSVVGAEWGFIGTIGLIGLYSFIAYRGFQISINARDTFGTLLAAGITISMVTQTLIHIGGVTHSIPFTGVTLPLVSYGGSSMLSTMVAIGILLAVSRGTEAYEKSEALEDSYETDDIGWRNRGTRVPRTSRS